MITLIEVLRILLMTAAIGYIFSITIIRHETYDPLKPKKKFSWDGIKIGVLAAAPGVILHEMAHKFVALAYGLNAEFFASYIGLAIGIILKAVGSPFLIFIPGYVQISGGTPLQSAITAFAGPLMNGLLWLVSWYILRNYKNLSENTILVLTLNKRINGILFLFNLIPIPPFDGSKVAQGIIEHFRTI